jgi:triphosphoribosyl-dephospho-CoA synthase
MTPATAIPRRVLSAKDVAMAAQLACLLEASAPKPGNVAPGRHFADLRYEDFLVSALAIGDPVAGAGGRGVGSTIRFAIETTSRWARSNTNLGIVLLFAPLARAAVAGSQGASLRDALRDVLDATTVDDARDTYAAIRLASPGGLGRADTQDVSGEPTMRLLDVMRLAADRDGIAREYATAFDATFEIGVPALTRARLAGLPWDDAVVETFVTLLAAQPDTHVRRRGGPALAVEISRRARAVLDLGGVRTPGGRKALDGLDRDLRDPRNIGNPGTTADLTASAIFVVLLEGGWKPAGASVDGGTDATPR